MKKGIFCILVCMLLIAIVLPAASAMNLQTAWYMKENNYSAPYPSTLAFSLGFITIKIVATVTDVSDSDNLLGGAIDVGDTITGKYIYNSRTPDSAPSYPETGYYQSTSFPCGIKIDAGGFVFKTNPRDVDFSIWIYNDFVSYGNPPLDAFQVVSTKNLPLSNGMLVDFIVWELIDSTGTALSSDDLPTTAPVLTDWDYYYGMDLMLNGKDPSNTHKSYQITAHVTEATKNNAVDVYGAESDWRTPSITMPYSYNLPFMQFWMKVLEWFPNTFLLLHYLLGFNQ